MTEKSLTNKITGSVFWAAIDKFGVVLLQFVINLILARLLTPDDFGLVGMIMIIVAVSNILTDAGFGAALIQNKKVDETDLSTIFFVNIIISVLLYAIIYASSIGIASFLGSTALVKILRVLGIVIVINSIGLVSKAQLRRALAFKPIAISNIVSYILSAIVAIVMARHGYGVYGLVAMYITNSLMSNTLLCICAHWIPKRYFSIHSLKKNFAYGSYILITDILSNICFHIQNTLVGKYFSPYTAGQYAQAKKMEEVACITLPSAMNQVLFPLYSKMQDDLIWLKDKLRMHTKLIAFVLFPLLTLLIIIAKPVILLLFGEKWMDSIPYFQALCIGGYFCSLQYFNYYAVAAIGKSRALFFAGVFKCIVLIGLLSICARISMNAVLIAIIVSNFVNYITNAILAQRYINYDIYQQVADVISSLISSVVSGIIVIYLRDAIEVHWILTALIYVMLYMIISMIVNNPLMHTIFNYLKRGIN